MKTQTQTLFLLAAFASLAGCIRTTHEIKPITTTHEIKPIHITMDINLKIDKALDNAIEDRKSVWQERKPKIDALKAAGTVGENNAGLLEPIPGAALDSEAFKLISAANSDREKMYASIAEKQNTTAEAVGKRRAVRIAEDAALGAHLQDAEGNWAQKQ
jgi:Uncharacterized protein conserved in bacteria